MNSSQQRDIHHARGAALLNLCGAVFAGVMTLINEILAARFLGVAVYGLFALGMLLTKIGEVVSLFGLRMAVLHYIPIYREQNDQQSLFNAIIGGLFLPLAIGLLFAFIIWQFAPWLASSVFNEPASLAYIKLLVWAVPAMALTEVIGHITRAYGYARYYVLLRNIIPPLLFFLLLLLLMYKQEAATSIGIVYPMSFFTALVVGLFVLKNMCGPALWKQKFKAHWGPLYRYAFPVFINTFLYMLVGWSDIFVVGLYLEASDVGRYRACMQFVMAFDLIAVALSSAIVHRYSVLDKQGRLDEVNNLFQHNIRWIVIMVLPLAVILVFNAVLVLNIVGPDFVAARILLILLTVAYLIKSIGTSSGISLVVTNRQRVETKIAFIVAGLNISLNLFLVPKYGVNGAAMATLFSFICLTLMRVFAAGRYIGLQYPFKIVAKLVLVFFITGWLVFVILYQWLDAVILLKLTGLALALIGLTWKVALSVDEKKWLIGFFKR